MGFSRRRAIALAIALVGLAHPAFAEGIPGAVGPRAIAEAALVETPDFSFRMPRTWRRAADTERPPGAILALAARSTSVAATFAVYRRPNRPRFVHDESRLWVLARPRPTDSFDVQVLDGAIGFARSAEQLPSGGTRVRSSFQRGAVGYEVLVTRAQALTAQPDGATMAAATWRWADAALGAADDPCRAWATERDRNVADASGLFRLLMSPPLCAYPDEPTVQEPYRDALTGTERYLTRYYTRKLTALGCP